MQLISAIYSILTFIASILLIGKADEIDGIITFVFSPVILHKVVFSKRRYILMPIAIVASMIFISPLFVIAALIWHFIFSISLAKAFGETIVYGIFLAILPGISMIILGFGKSEYEGPVNLFSFLG